MTHASPAANARRQPGLRGLAESIAPIVDPLLSRQGFAGSRVVQQWANIVGKALADRTLPEKLVRGANGRGGTLQVRIASGAVAVELQHLQPLIVQRINAYFGYEAVSRLKLRHAPLPNRPPPRAPRRRLSAAETAEIEALTADVGDPALRAVLQSLGRSIAAAGQGQR